MQSLFTFWKAKWAKQKENHATKVTKIPKTKRQKYGMNKTFEKSNVMQLSSIPYFCE